MLGVEASLRGNPDRLLSTHGSVCFAMPLLFDAVAWPLRSIATAASFSNWPMLQMISRISATIVTFGGIFCNGLFVGSHLGILPEKTDAGRALEAAQEARLARHLSEKAKTD